MYPPTRPHRNPPRGARRPSSSPTRLAPLIAGSRSLAENPARLSPSLVASALTLALTACGGAHGGSSSESESAATAVAALSTRNNLIKNATFDDGVSLPWTTSFTDPATGHAAVEDAAFCLHIDNAGTNPFDAQFRHREMVIQKGHEYQIQFVAYADKATKVRAKVGMAGPPYAEYWNSTIDLTQTPQLFQGGFTMQREDDPTAEFAFHVGGPLAGPVPLVVCIDDVHLNDPLFQAPPQMSRAPVAPIRINQIGYVTHLAKIAVYKTAATEPLAWKLEAADGSVVAEGKTQTFGNDPDAGEGVQIIDFTSFDKPGKDYVLEVAGEKSPKFPIGDDLYAKLKYDAASYFYLNRSGIELKMPYTREAQWARPAGHMTDKAVACAPDIGCKYSLNVLGGWYDAGDYGKYVVNGGITVWTLLNLYERTKYLGGDLKALADKTFNIPESGNGVPDVLDEARWEMEFLLRMQVPDGQPMAGMAHHKIHDEKWTALGIAPHESTLVNRYLRPVSTAATLNLAASGAQCARVWKEIDPAFSQKCLSAAEKAWQAALAHPNLLITTKDEKGGGSYFDERVHDEFYWAAAELYITTGKAEYKDSFTKSQDNAPFPTRIGGGFASFNWQDTAGAGKISLATVPSQLSPAEVAKIREEIAKAADVFLEFIKEQGYKLPLKDENGQFPWGSNSFVLNNLQVLALAYDYTKKREYLDGVETGIGYLLGRNPLGQSYVTGYGVKPLHNPHHRFWSHQANAKYPEAPPGVVSGGPNSSLQDPYVQAAGMKNLPPEKCFIDNIEAWSVNEITINWNAPLAWVAMFLDEKAHEVKTTSASAGASAGATAEKPKDAPKGDKPKDAPKGDKPKEPHKK